MKNKIKLSGVLAVSALAISSIVSPTVSALSEAWGPQDRQFFDYNGIPASYPTFNSMINSPIYNAGTGQYERIGDERNFVTVRECDSVNGTECISSQTYQNTDADGNIVVTEYTDYVDVKPGKFYEVYVFYHNNASASYNASGQGIAENVRLKMDSPNWLDAGQTAVMRGTISWSNPYNNALNTSDIWGKNPGNVWDTAFLTATERVYLRYQHGSAVIHTNEKNITSVPGGVTANGQKLDDAALFGDGAKLAWNAASEATWGLIPGCNEYAGYITFLVKAEQPKFYITKQAAKENTGSWNANIEMAPGETIDFKIHYRNQGTTNQNSIIVYDKLPEGFEYVAGSTKVVSPAAPQGTSVADKLFTDEGLNIGNYAPGDEAIITYKIKAKDDNAFKECNTVAYNEVRVATENGTEYDRVKMTVNKNCEMPKELPKAGVNTTVSVVVISTAALLTSWYVVRKARR